MAATSPNTFVQRLMVKVPTTIAKLTMHGVEYVVVGEPFKALPDRFYLGEFDDDAGTATIREISSWRDA